MRVVLLSCVAHALVCAVAAERASCYRGETAEETEYACIAPTSNFSLYVGNNYAKIECDEYLGGDLICAELPLLPELRDKALRSLSISYCRLPEEKIECSLRALGARSIRHLFLSNIPGGAAAALRADHLAGLNIVALTIREAQGARASLPLQALSALPALRAFTLHDAALAVSSGAFKTSPALTQLELFGCNVTSLPRNAFDGLSSLRRLILRNDGITLIDSGAFDGLPALEELDLAMNELRSLPLGVFNSVTSSLRFLVLSGNPLENMSEGVLNGLGRLQRIDLFDGHSSLLLGPRALADLTTLQEAQLSRCKMEALPGDALRGSRALSQLNLAMNRLRYLPADLLHDQTELRTLDLSANQIEVIEPPMFASLAKLVRLDLRKNLIEVLPDEVFSGLSSVTWMSLSDNRLRHIAPDAFPRGVPLLHLSLARNDLVLRAEPSAPLVPSAPSAPSAPSIADDTLGVYGEESSPLATLIALRDLDLSHNRVDTLLYDWRVQFTYLEKLNLTFNNITLLLDSEVNFLQENITVDLRSNDIKMIALSDASRGPRSAGVNSRILFDSTALNCDCQLHEALKRVRGGPAPLSEPRLEPAPSTACAAPAALATRPLHSLRPAELACSLPCLTPCTMCQLRPAAAAPLELTCESLPESDALDHYYELQDFNLERYARVSLALRRPLDELGALPPRVLSLNLAGLGLTSAPRGPPPPDLLEIDLSNNHIETIPLELVPKGTSLKIRLAQNPFLCDCAHWSDVEELQRRNESVLDYSTVQCADGQGLWRVDASRLCGVRAAAIAAGALALLVIAAAAIAAMALRSRARLRVWLLSRGWCTRCFGDGNEPYDAFVAFAYEDRRFVMDTLVERLESPPFGYRLCVQYRDWFAGGWVPAEIERSVNMSRRTIVVVSSHFLETPWSLLEFRAAQTRALREGRARVVAVLLEEVGENARLAGDLRAYLRSHAPLRWGENRFWWRLRRALGRRRTSSPHTAPASPLLGRFPLCTSEDGKLLPFKSDKF